MYLLPFHATLDHYRRSNIYDDMMEDKEKNNSKMKAKDYLVMMYITDHLERGLKVYQIRKQIPEKYLWLLRGVSRAFLAPYKLDVKWDAVGRALKDVSGHDQAFSKYCFEHFPFLP